MLEYMKKVPVSRPKSKSKPKPKMSLDMEKGTSTEAKKKGAKIKKVERTGSTKETTKKPSAPQRASTSDRDLKVQKTENTDVTANMKSGKIHEEANVKRKKTGSCKDALIRVDDDSEDDALFVVQTGRPSPKLWTFLNDDEDVKPSVEYLEPSITSSIETQISRKKVDETKAQADRVEKLQKTPASQLILIKNLEAEIRRLKSDHEAELARFKQEKDEEIDERILEKEVQYQKKNVESMEEKARQSTENAKVRKERDELVKSIDAEKMRVMNLEEASHGLSQKLANEQQKNIALTTNNNLLQDDITTLKQQLEGERAARAEAENSLQVQSDMAAELASLKHLNGCLSAEIEALKREAEKSTPSFSSVEDTKVENVRKTYIRVKMKYDNLFSIAKQLSISTRGMALGNFGEFGDDLWQLRKAVEGTEAQEKVDTSSQ